MGARGTLTLKVLGDDAGLSKTLAHSEKSLMSFGKKVAGAYLGFEAAKKAAEYIKSATEEAAKEERMFKTLNTVIKNVTGATDKQAEAVDKWVKKAMLATGFADEELAPAMAKLTAATKDTTKAQDLLNVAMDVARGRNVELGTVVLALSKAQNGSLVGLQRLGVAVKDAAGNTKSFNTILGDLTQTYGGAAAEWANTVSGRMERLKLAFKETKKSIGEAFIPILERALPVVQKFAEWMTQLTGSFAETAKTKGLGAAFKGLTEGIGKAIQSYDWTPVGQVISNVIATSIKVAVPAIADMLGRALVEAMKGPNAGDSGLGYQPDRAQKWALGNMSWWNPFSHPEMKALIAKANATLGQAVNGGANAVYSGLGRYSHNPVGVGGDLGAGATGSRVGGTQGAQVLQMLDAITKQTAADTEKLTAAYQGLNSAMSGAAERELNLGQMWEDSRGSLKNFNKALKEHLGAWADFQANMQTISDKIVGYTPDVKAKILASIASMPAEMAAALADPKNKAAFDETIKGLADTSGAKDAAGQWSDNFLSALGPTTTEIVRLMQLDLRDAGYSSGRSWRSGFTTGAGGGTMSQDASIPKGTHGGRILAEGGVISRPTLALVGEAGPEAVIPLRNPGRAAQVMAEAGVNVSDPRVVALLQQLVALAEDQNRAYRTGQYAQVGA